MKGGLIGFYKFVHYLQFRKNLVPSSLIVIKFSAVHNLTLPPLALVLQTASLICRSQVAGHCFTNTESILKANLRPKNFCLGLIRPKVSF